MTKPNDSHDRFDSKTADILEAGGLDRRGYLRLLAGTVLAGRMVSSASATRGTDECLSVPVAVAGDDGHIDDVELLQAIRYWRLNMDVPGTCGKTIDDETIQDLIEAWQTNTEVDTEDDGGQSFDELLYVDTETGSDDGPGTQDDPLETIQAAMDRATEHKNDGRSVHVDICPGTYRESVEFAYSNYEGGGTDAPVVVEGAGPGETIIKGSEVFEGWQEEGGNRFSHDWGSDWGVADDPTGGYITDCETHPSYCADSPELVLRREMVFVDGERMRQVLATDAMEPGTYFVDDSNDRLYLEPPTEISLSEATVEVSVRPNGWFTQHENNVTIRNLGIEHVATPWTQGKAAMVLDGDDLTVENVRVVENNYTGLFPSGENITLRNVTLDRNGANGLGPYKVINFLLEGGSVNANNWRGGLGGYTGWSVGNKFFKGHGVTIRDTSFNDNQSRGLWFDNDLKDVLIEDVELEGNRHDNIFLEQLQGPVTLRRVVSTESGEYGLLLGNAAKITVEDSRLVDNQHGGIHVSGVESGRTFTNFESQEAITVKTRHLSVHDSVISGVNGEVRAGNSDNGRYLIGTTFYDSWPDFIDTYEADGNTWYDSQQREAFEWRGNELLTFEEWQDRTGQDQNSVWRPPVDS